MRLATAWLLRPLPFGGLVGSVIFFALAMTPSLIPRSWSTQGFLAGLTAAVGLGVGSAASALIRATPLQEPNPQLKRRAWITLLVAGPLVIVVSVWLGARWDQDLRGLMGADVENVWNDAGTIALAVITALILVGIARLLRGLGHLCILGVNRVLPRPVALAVGGASAAFLVVFVALGGLANALFEATDYSASIVDRTIQPDVDQPTSPMRSGSPESHITWDELGAKGREFAAGGPTVDQITDFTGEPAMEPIRIYGGLRGAASLEERVELVLAELDRADAWSRQAIIVQTPSGNGEIPRVNAAAPEFIFGGDVAQVALQYSYAPSFTTMVLKPGAGQDAGRAMVTAVRDRLVELPETRRPRFYIAGESLGSSSTEAAFDDLDALIDTVDGALFVGPTFFNDIRNELTEHRDAGSPVWRPVVDDGAVVRFAIEPVDLSTPSAAWDGVRVVYLQNSSDPVAWFRPRLLYSRPEFLDDPRGPDVSSNMVYVPLITFWQTLLDLPFASGAPAGHGHRYGLNVADGWIAVIGPPDWTDQDTSELRDALDAL